MEKTTARGPVNWDIPGPQQMRSSLILESLAHMVLPRRFEAPSVQVQLTGTGTKYLVSSADGADTIPQVVGGELDIAMINPAGLLHAAYYGVGPFKEPQPVRAIAVMPSLDWFVFAVTEKTGITSLAQVKEQKYPLRISVRPPQAILMYTNAVLNAYGFSLEDVVSWGGRVSYDRQMLFLPERYERVTRGEIDMIVDEGITRFVPMLEPLSMRFLPLEEEILQQMDAIYFSRHVIPKSMFPALPADVPTVDFSGWTVYTRENLSEEFVYQFCRSMDARKESIPWEEPGALPTQYMCKDSEWTPLKIPLHPGAERYWREAGYL